MSKIALSMIVKGGGNEPKRLKRALLSAASHVDGIFITFTGKKEDFPAIEAVCKEFKVNLSSQEFNEVVTQDTCDWIQENLQYESHVKPGDTVFNFGAARNFNLQQIPQEYDWIFWMDCDDSLRNGDKMKMAIKMAEKNNIDLLYFNYLYHVKLDAEGAIQQVFIQHPRERLFRNNSTLVWTGMIHEIIKTTPTTVGIGITDCDVVHLAQHEDQLASLQRNIRSLEVLAYQEKGENSRTLYYLAKVFQDLREDKYDQLAQALMFEFVAGKHKSGWEEEKAQAWLNIAEIYRRHNECDKAITAVMNGLMDFPENPQMFISLATSYVMKMNWKRALFWLSLAKYIPTLPSLLQDSPFETELKILEIEYNCYYNLGMFEEVRATANRIAQILPNNPLAAATLQKIEQNLNIPLTN